MKIVCASGLAFGEEAFSSLGSVTVRDDRSISAADVADASLLAIRSTTGADAALLRNSSVRFVGTATIGIDHMDVEFLEKNGVRWCYAPGCNANSVAEYVMSALLLLTGRHDRLLADMTIGIVGLGNVGSRVAEKAGALGMRVLKNDPPLERELRGRSDHDFDSLDAVLAASDVVTLHVPLTRQGPDPTFHLADETFFSRMKTGSIFLNTARGPVADTDALIKAIEAGRPSHVVVDTWEGEPRYRHDLLECTEIGTPHIAGYSFDGKVNGTVAIYREACQFLGKSPAWAPKAYHVPTPLVEIDATHGKDEVLLNKVVKQVYDIAADDAAMRHSCAKDSEERCKAFDALRADYQVRREFGSTQVDIRNGSDALIRKVRALGFRL